MSKLQFHNIDENINCFYDIVQNIVLEESKLQANTRYCLLPNLILRLLLSFSSFLGHFWWVQGLTSKRVEIRKIKPKKIPKLILDESFYVVDPDADNCWGWEDCAPDLIDRLITYTDKQDHQ